MLNTTQRQISRQIDMYQQKDKRYMEQYNNNETRILKLMDRNEKIMEARTLNDMRILKLNYDKKRATTIGRKI